MGRAARHHGLARLAEARGRSPTELVLAWIASLGLVPLPGPSRIETLESCVRGARHVLDDEARRALDAAFPEGGRLREPRSVRAPDPEPPREVRLVLGSPGAGKTTHARRYVEAGYARLNRDERGGTLRGLLGPLGELLDGDGPSVVLDNTYPARSQRYDVIEAAWARGVPVRATFVDTPPADCERNAIERMLGHLDRLPEPHELERLNKANPAILPPKALTSFRSRFEAPSLDEGFAAIEIERFERRPGAGEPGVIVDPADLARFSDALRATSRVALVVGWQEGADPVEAAAAVQAEASGLGLLVHAAICPHPGGPPVCWCRKPWLGLPVLLARHHGVDLAGTVVVATSPADRTLAAKLGVPAIERPDDLD